VRGHVAEVMGRNKVQVHGGRSDLKARRALPAGGE
jgi:hypothetical protein